MSSNIYPRESDSMYAVNICLQIWPIRCTKIDDGDRWERGVFAPGRLCIRDARQRDAAQCNGRMDHRAEYLSIIL